MSRCYLIRIWRRAGIDLVKIWLAYKEEVNTSLSDSIDILFKKIFDEIIPELNEKIKNELENKFGKEVVDEIKDLEDEMILYGNYDSNLEPVIGYEYIWWETLAGIFFNLPPELEKLVLMHGDFQKTGTYGSFLRKGLVKVTHDKYPITLVFGINIVRKKNDECLF